MRSRSAQPSRRNRALVVALGLGFLPLTGCGTLATFVQQGGLAKITPLLSALVGAQQASQGSTFGAQNTSASLSSGTQSPGAFGSTTPNPGGGLSLMDALNGKTQSADGVLNLPIMAQSSGGEEAAIRGCGPTSLLMATGRGDPGQIQSVLVETCERPGGLVADRAVSWLRSNGFARSEHSFNWTVEMLRNETMTQRNPVVINFLNPNSGNGHIVVVVGVTDQGVHINDPGPGAKRVLSVQQFESQWAARNQWDIPVRS